MATARRPIEIFQDPVPSYDHHEIQQVEAALLSGLQPTAVSSDHHTLLNPPNTSASVPSPRKPARTSSSPPPHILEEKSFNSIPPPRQRAPFTDSIPKKQMTSRRLSETIPQSHQNYFATFASAQMLDKENIYSSRVQQVKAQRFSQPDYGVKAPLKRTLSDAAPLKERTANKKQKPQQEEPYVQYTGPECLPAIEDDGAKPDLSYAQLIAAAILRAPTRKLTLAQIYKWISDNYKFYRAGETGWQNSIRHNLSLNKAFVKKERPKDDPGKGNYWAIEEGMEGTFLKGKAARRPTNPEGPSFLSSGPIDMARPSTAPSMGTFTPQPTSFKSIDSSKFPEETELSSDATIPASDPDIHDAGQNYDSTMPPPARIQSSPPPAEEIHSSPPPPVSRPPSRPVSRRGAREGTPPRLPRFPSTSRSGGRKRKFAALGDSGYYSSIESSAIKGNPAAPLLTSEADLERPVHKRGRAEEEIARIRGSSYDSPTKTRPYMKQPTSHLPSSSPFRPFDHNNPRAPLTPNVVFKKPAKPPQSVSPNTNLRNHRDRIKALLGSPDKSIMGDWQDPMSNIFSPAFRLPVPDENNFNLHEDGFDASFDVFGAHSFDSSPSRLSPEKRPSKRPSLMRASTTANILADITGLKSNQNTPSREPKSRLRSPVRLESPSKAALPTFQLEGADMPDGDLFGLAELYSDGSEEGVDILQNFGKIGAPAQPQLAPPQQNPACVRNGSPIKKGRPGLGRSSTSLF